MIGVLLKYWQVCLGAGATLIIGYMLHTIVLRSAVLDKEMEMRLACIRANEISNEVSNDYQKNLSDLNNRMLDYDGVRECVPVSDTAGGRDDSPQGQGHAGADGVNPTTLYRFARDAEQYRIQLTACQDFVRRASK